jgi:hypothetical protein
MDIEAATVWCQRISVAYAHCKEND